MIDLPPSILNVFIFLFGLAAGSFMNVCIYRIPRGFSIIRPASRCPHCNTPIRPFDNIPLLSFIILKGRCRTCGARIHWRYPLVELLNAILWILVFNSFSASLAILPLLFFVSSLIVITFIDLEHMIIPDIITIPGTFTGIALSLLIPDPFFRLERLGLMNSLTGALTGFLLFFIIAIIGSWIFRKEAMGGGDVKLMAMIGAFTGWKGVLLTTFAGSLIGSIAGITMILTKKTQDRIIPFGPYLAAGAIVSLLYGQEITGIWLR
ncbi:MAG: prepilin peptidase [Thermodesulfovibrionales bacterium]